MKNAGPSGTAFLFEATQRQVLCSKFEGEGHQRLAQPLCVAGHGNLKRRTRVIALKPLQETAAYKPKEPCARVQDIPTIEVAPRPSTRPVTIPRQLKPLSEKQQDVTPSQVHIALSTTSYAKDEEALGSWTDRKTMHPLCKNSTASPFQMARPAVGYAKPQTSPHKESRFGESAANRAEKAWRRRFVLKWRKELARSCKFCNDDVCDDPWHAALHMLQAANVHPDQHMPMPDHDCYPAGASPSPLLSVDDDLENALEVEQDVAEPADVASETCTIQSAFLEAACRARQLLKYQVNRCALVINTDKHWYGMYAAFIFLCMVFVLSTLKFACMLPWAHLHMHMLE